MSVVRLKKAMLAMAVATVVGGARCAIAAPATQPVKSPSAERGSFDEQDWVVFVCDANHTTANRPAAFGSTLPEFIATRRGEPETPPPNPNPNNNVMIINGMVVNQTTAAPAQPTSPTPADRNAAMPVGVIRIFGDAESAGTKIDISLQTKGATVFASWPKAETRSTSLLWQDMDLETDPGDTRPESIDAAHWFTGLRAVPSAYLSKEKNGDRFLLYDMQVPYPVPIKLSGDASKGYGVTNSGPESVLDVEIFRPADDGWHTGMLDTLPVTAKSNGPATKPATRPVASTTRPSDAAAAETVFEDTVEVHSSSADARAGGATAEAKVSGGIAGSSAGASTGTGSAASTRPAVVAHAAPATQPTTAPSQTIALSSMAIKEPAQLLAPMKKHLLAAGLNAGDVETIDKIVASEALDSKHMTLVYRLDSAEMDRLLPLDITPTPRKITRVGVVVVKNVDPALVGQIDRLIAQLGDAEWSKRESAQQQLTEIGPPARPKLEQATRNKDMEIVYRSERLLATIGSQKD